MQIQVEHPTDKANFYLVTTTNGEKEVTVAFSYFTPIGFRDTSGEWVIRQNDWSNTTGRHLNYLDADKRVRISGADFERLLAEVVI